MNTNDKKEDLYTMSRALYTLQNKTVEKVWSGAASNIQSDNRFIPNAILEEMKKTFFMGAFRTLSLYDELLDSTLPDTYSPELFRKVLLSIYDELAKLPSMILDDEEDFSKFSPQRDSKIVDEKVMQNSWFLIRRMILGPGAPVEKILSFKATFYLGAHTVANTITAASIPGMPKDVANFAMDAMYDSIQTYLKEHLDNVAKQVCQGYKNTVLH